eukprot:7812112-Karenia_brevis.AAC.1
MAYAATVKRVDDQLKKVEADAKEKADKEEADKAPAVEGDPEVLLGKMVEDAVDARLKENEDGMDVDDQKDNNPSAEFMSLVMKEVKTLVSEEVKQGVEAAKNSLSPTDGWGQNQNNKKKGKGKGKGKKGKGRGKGKKGKGTWRSNDGWQQNNTNNRWDGNNANQNGGNGGKNGKKKWWN